MTTDLLTIELALKGGLGTILFLFPITFARVAGLPHGNVGLWPRLLGAALLGMALAIWVENDVKDVSGLGLGGLIAINAVGLVSLLITVIMTPLPTVRGRIALWATIAALFGLSILEIVQLR